MGSVAFKQAQCALSGESEAFIPQPANLVAQPGCLLKLQIAGMLIHRFFHFGDIRRRGCAGPLPLVSGRDPSWLPRADPPRTLTRPFHDVCDRLDDTARLNAVFGVETDLLPTPPIRFIDGTLH